MKLIKLLIIVLIFPFFIACSEQNEEKEAETTEFLYVVGTWRLSDIKFLTPSDNPEIQFAMDKGRTDILKQIVKMTFKADYTAIENVNGQFQTGKWSIQNDSIMSVQFANQPSANVMILRSHSEDLLQFVIGTPEDRSLYSFRKEIQ